MTVELPTGVTIRLSDDWHVHVRDGAMLRTVIAYTARIFRYALVMPNLDAPVTSTAAAAAYRERILEAAGSDKSPEFEPLMSAYLTPDVSAGHAEGRGDDHITTSQGDRVDVFSPAEGRRWEVRMQPGEGGHA